MNLFLYVHMQQIMGRMYMGLESVQQIVGWNFALKGQFLVGSWL
jgi:hypothetical protein